MVVLGIETSCDDTAISIIENGIDIYNKKISSEYLLKKYNGIVPEIASRKHEESISILLKDIKDKYDLNKIDYIAYTNEPGLPGSLHVGKIFAKSLGFILNKKIVKVNHINGHIFSSFINRKENISYPFLSLIASGGTTSLFLVKSIDEIIEVCKTSDDAIGEVFDKVGRILGLEYPGGPSIDKIFNINKVNKSLINIYDKNNNIFSFSGVKTKIQNIVNTKKMKNEEIDVVEIASSFQYWAINELINKINYYAKQNNIKIISIGGGVSANKYFRSLLNKQNYDIYIPEQQYSCDNAVMIAFFGYLKLNNN